jgi:glutamate racemase
LNAEAPIAVFDSGVGGLSVLRALRAVLPHERFVYFSDAAHAPYGERDEAFVARRSLEVAAQLVEEDRIKALVVACNTATAAAIHLLRERHPRLPLVGVEPALKPAAAQSRTKRVAVFATHGTLASAKFAALHASLKSEADFVLQPCDGLASAIEAGDDEMIAALCRANMSRVGPFGDGPGCIDTIVLGCTHYPFAWHHFQAVAGTKVRMIETGEPVAAQSRRLLEAKELLRGSGAGDVEFRSSGSLAALRAAAARWLAP